MLNNKQDRDLFMLEKRNDFFPCILSPLDKKNFNNNNNKYYYFSFLAAFPPFSQGMEPALFALRRRKGQHQGYTEKDHSRGVQEHM